MPPSRNGGAPSSRYPDPNRNPKPVEPSENGKPPKESSLGKMVLLSEERVNYVGALLMNFQMYLQDLHDTCDLDAQNLVEQCLGRVHIACEFLLKAPRLDGVDGRIASEDEAKGGAV